ncbi:MAG: class I SAM-dependent methyltransferase [Spirochaetia bacterium]|nr:class I SAM-dependent methyltransferase [Spirochaetia bacterium]
MKPENLDRFYRFHSLIYDFTRPLFLPNRLKAVKALNIQPKDSIIDFGCGTGYNLQKIIKINSNVNIKGIDFSKYMLKKAEKKVPLGQFFTGDIKNIKLEMKADKIISSYVLSMIDDWQKAILNMKKHLKKNGVLVIIDFHPFQGKLKPLYPLFNFWLKAHGVYARDEITGFVKKHFKSVEEKKYYSGYCFLLKAKYPLN